MSLPPPPVPALADTALFVDFDGTLVDIAPTPEAVRVPIGLLDVLERLGHRLDGALALVSGRPVAEIDAFVAPHRLTVAGLHGLDLRRQDGRRHRPEEAAAAIDRIRPQLTTFAAAHPGVLLEDKGLTLVLHYRAVPHLEAQARAAAEAALAAGEGLALLHGKMVVELKPAGVDKGQAIRELMAEPPFQGRRPVFLGDDVTDEAGFAAVNALGGTSVVVDRQDRPTAAAFGLASVGAVHGWLERLADGAAP